MPLITMVCVQAHPLLNNCQAHLSNMQKRERKAGKGKRHTCAEKAGISHRKMSAWQVRSQNKGSFRTMKSSACTHASYVCFLRCAHQPCVWGKNQRLSKIISSQGSTAPSNPLGYWTLHPCWPNNGRGQPPAFHVLIPVQDVPHFRPTGLRSAQLQDSPVLEALLNL